MSTDTSKTGSKDEFEILVNNNGNNDSYEINEYNSALYLNTEEDEEEENIASQIKQLEAQYNIDEKKLLRKVDLFVLPPFALLFFISFLNKSSFGLLYVEGILESLNMNKFQLCGAYSAFFAPIICFQFFANIVLRIIKPHFFIGLTVLFYGVFNLACGFCKNYHSFLVLQLFHGIFQSGSETAVIYIMCHFYNRYESQKRFGGLYSINCLAGMTINLISMGINQNLNDQSLEPWRILMIVLGAITMAAAIILFFVIPDFPEGARFFNDNEAFFMIKKLELYGGKSGYNLSNNSHEIYTVLKDSLIFLPCLACIGMGYVCNSYSLFEPIVFQESGSQSYTIAYLNRYSTYPWIVAFFYVIITCLISTQLKFRFIVMFFNIIVAVIGGVLMQFTPYFAHNKYIGNFFLVCGSFAQMPFIVCWTTSNVCGHLRKSILTSLEISMFDLGGLLTLIVFIYSETSSKSQFQTAYIVGYSLEIVGVSLLVVYLFQLKRYNNKKNCQTYKAQFSEMSNRAQIVFGDKNPKFKYIY